MRDSGRCAMPSTCSRCSGLTDFRMYQAANARFAAAVCEEAGGGSPLVLVQDYHFALAPRMLRQRLPLSTVVAFWHIPWPRPRVFRTVPGHASCSMDCSAATSSDSRPTRIVRTFSAASNRSSTPTSIAGRTSSPIRGHSTHVRAYPGRCRMGESGGSHDAAIEQPVANVSVATCNCRPACQLGVGIDRLDYTKGINEKFLAIERLLEMRPGAQRTLRVRAGRGTEPRVSAGIPGSTRRNSSRRASA